MDPQSQTFTPQTDGWRLTQAVRRIEDAQQDFGERLIRVEKRLEDEARMKSVWGSSSPFPGVLSGTPQQGPVHHPAGSDFANFDDDQSNTMVRSLQLDAEDEPRRFGATSRTNSVRFDESANQAQWSHGPRPSVDLITRSSSGLSGLGGHPLLERTPSHKSDGRHSSTGHSVVSGRANSFGLDTGPPFGNSLDVPGLAPGLFILGSVPAIIRCWLTTNFKSEALLYAAVCTGSYKSYLDARLVKALGFSNRVRHDISKNRKIKLPIYFPEAVPQMASSRSNSPISQLPTLTIDFIIIEPTEEQATSKAIQIFLGSDMLRAHNADVLFSSNVLTLFDDDRNKLSIPLVRPENEEAFKSLNTTSSPIPQLYLPQVPRHLSGLQQRSADNIIEDNLSNGAAVGDAPSSQAQATSLPSPIARPHRSTPDDGSQRHSMEETGIEEVEEPSPKVETALSELDTSRSDKKDSSEASPSITTPSRTTSSPAIWNNWRRDGGGSYPQGDWANASRNSAGTYARPSREQGIKVLRPSRTSSRSFNAPLSASPVTGQSRFFDDGKRRNGSAVSPDPAGPESPKRTTSEDINKSSGKENTQNTGGKGRGSNPVGGASAFGWLNSRQQK